MESNSGCALRGTSLAGQLAILEVAAEDDEYKADALVRHAARASQLQHNQQQAQAMRDKAHLMLESGWVVGALEVGSGAAQIGSACSQFASDSATIAAADRPPKCELKSELALEAAHSSRDAKYLGTASTLLGTATKVSDLAFGAAETNDDAHAMDEAHAAENAKGRADDASSAGQRAQAQLDQKLAVIEELMRSDAETMRNLIHPA